MKQLYLFIILFLIIFTARAQTFCSPDGDVAIFSNYDGGVLQINVDLPIPNLKIGIVSYEDDSVIISGPYAANVSRVIYAGYFNSNNVHCSPDIDVKGVYGVDTSIVDINFIPAATLSNSNGYLYIICNTSCVLNASQGGCNTADQVEDYFFNQFGSNKLLFHRAQYGCWTGTQSLSAGGNCCALSTGIPSMNAGGIISVHVNSVTGKLIVEGAEPSNGEAQICDVVGNVILRKTLPANRSGNGREEIDISTLARGVYFLRMPDGKGMMLKRFVRE